MCLSLTTITMGSEVLDEVADNASSRYRGASKTRKLNKFLSVSPFTPAAITYRTQKLIDAWRFGIYPCLFITVYNKSNVLPFICYLLKQIIVPLQSADTVF